MIVKVCGVRTIRDIDICLDAGVDWLGLNLVPGSRREVSEEDAAALVSHVRGRARMVGIFADTPPSRIREILQKTGIELAQLHGREPLEWVADLGACAFKAVRLGTRADVEIAMLAPGSWVLLDAHAGAALGGTGARIHERLAFEVTSRRLALVAGGLTPESVAQTIGHLRPFAVDVASGVEKAPGEKDAALVARFVRAAREAASSLGL